MARTQSIFAPDLLVGQAALLMPGGSGIGAGIAQALAGAVRSPLRAAAPGDTPEEELVAVFRGERLVVREAPLRTELLPPPPEGASRLSVRVDLDPLDHLSTSGPPGDVVPMFGHPHPG